MRSTRDLMDLVPQVGEVRWIGLRPERRAPLQSVDSVTAEVGRGLIGDRAAARAPDPARRRQVTLIQAELLPVVAALLDRPAIDPGLLRRNLVIAGINLRSLAGRRVRVGEVVLEVTGECHPCSRMEENLGPGGFQAMRGHGGWNARVVEAGTLTLGAHVEALPRIASTPEPADAPDPIEA